MKKNNFLGKCAFACMLFLFAFGSLFAQSVTENQASTVCQRFLMERFIGKPMPVFILREVAVDENGDPYLYRYSLEPKGFVLISASKVAMPVLAYSFDDDYELIPPIKDVFTAYKKEIRFAESKVKSSGSTAEFEGWDHYLAESFTPKESKVPNQSYLLSTRWNQNMYYNTYCPWDAQSGAYYDYRVPNGCVALATAQIMNYHRYPLHGTGACAYVSQDYGMQSANFGQETYHWDAMCNQPESYANEIAKLAYHVGVAIRMQYTPDGSGAQTEDAAKRLYGNFGYDQSISKYTRDSYVDSAQVQEYIEVLKNEIDNRRPILYSGHPGNGSAGHAFVLDGCDAQNRFHINWGWGGGSNAFFAMDNFVVGGSNYDHGSVAITRIFPSGAVAPTYCQGRQSNTASFGYVADGSPTAKPYQANPDCSWIVAAPGATSYTFKFDRLDLNPNVDFVTIYNGPTENSGVKATFTGNNIPSDSYTVMEDSVLITFTTVGSVTENTDYYGFLISYTSTSNEYTPCGEYTNVGDWHAVLTDGTDDGTNYSPDTKCTWNVSLRYITGYAFSFPKFDLGYGDFVEIYDNTTNPAQLHARYDLNNMPDGVINVNFKKMRVVFVADNWDQNDGFKLDYWAIASVDDHNGVQDAQVYPNPVADNLNVTFFLNEPENVTLKLMDASGRLLSMDVMNASAGENHHEMNVSSLSSGFYLLEIATPKGHIIRKITVQ